MLCRIDDKLIMSIEWKYKGFTLIELLVVVAIIVVLAAALFIILSPSELMKKSRDSRRVSELNTLNKAFSAALVYQEISFPPVVISDNSVDNPGLAVDGSGWFGGFSTRWRRRCRRWSASPSHKSSPSLRRP